MAEVPSFTVPRAIRRYAPRAIEARFEWGGNTRPIVLRIEPVPQPLGGNRWWFICPACARRTGRIYPIRAGLACRRCAELAYPACNLSRMARLRLKASKPLRRVGLNANEAYMRAAEGFPPRPPRMHRATYERLRGAYVRAREALEEHQWGELYSRFGKHKFGKHK